MIELTKNTKRVRNSKGELVTVYQVCAVEDFPVRIYDGSCHHDVIIRKGQLGGYAEKSAIVGPQAWLNKRVVILGSSEFYGVATSERHSEVEDSHVGAGSTISGSGAVIRHSVIGKDNTIFGSVRIFNTSVGDNATIIGTVVYDSEIGNNASVECAGVVRAKTIYDNEVCLHRTASAVWMPEAKHASS